ncbi:MAG: response regulator [Candidatus Natronoplasma sp.]
MKREDEKSEGKKVYNVLIVDDDTEVLKLLKRTLEVAKNMEYDVTIATNGKYGLKHVRETDYDIILSDYQMPQMDGIEFLKKVKEKSPRTLRFMITGEGDLNVAKEAINKADIDQYIEKPWDTGELLLTIRKELKERDEQKVVTEEEGEEVEETVPDVDSVEEAIKTVEAFQKKITEKPKESFEKEKMMFEFNTNEEFNEFSFQIKSKENINIEDVQIFENKYVITVGVYPRSYQKIK